MFPINHFCLYNQQMYHLHFLATKCLQHWLKFFLGRTKFSLLFEENEPPRIPKLLEVAMNYSYALDTLLYSDHTVQELRQTVA